MRTLLLPQHSPDIIHIIYEVRIVTSKKERDGNNNTLPIARLRSARKFRRDLREAYAAHKSDMLILGFASGTRSPVPLQPVPSIHFGEGSIANRPSGSPSVDNGVSYRGTSRTFSWQSVSSKRTKVPALCVVVLSASLAPVQGSVILSFALV